MSTRAQPVVIPGPNAQDMLGILTLPTAVAPLHSAGVLFVVGGPQYRVGSHRQFVELGRRIAAAGHPVLRFDFPGMGDSPGDVVHFENAGPYIAAAVDAFQSLRANNGKVVLWGLCDGASACLLYTQATRDPRVNGLVLLNPWVRSDEGLARARIKHYYRQRLMEPAFWRKFATGRIGWQALSGLAANLRTMNIRPAATLTFQELMANGWRALDGKILLFLSGRDLTAQEFREHTQPHPAWAGLLSIPQVTAHTLEGADHTFSSRAAQHEVERLMLDWLEGYGRCS